MIKLYLKNLKSLSNLLVEGIDDYTFAHKIYLNAIGRIPTLEELDTFIKDRLPSSKGHHSHMYHYWADLLRQAYWR